VDRTCEHCGKTFHVKASAVRYSGARYCSVKCHNDARRLPDVETHRLRGSYRYAAWRTKVVTRDRYTCQRCGQTRGKLNAHHVKPWAKHPELRFDVSNGITLCIPCHRAVHRGDNWAYGSLTSVSVSSML
jgi:5-methylcytosine-specific restriction endonuclease McrA